MAPEIQENHENIWKSMENQQKQRKMKKKKWSWKWKKWKSGLKVADSHSEPGNFQKRGKFSFFIICLSCFFSFSLPVAPESRKTMKINVTKSGRALNVCFHHAFFEPLFGHNVHWVPCVSSMAMLIFSVSPQSTWSLPHAWVRWSKFDTPP